MENWVEYVIGMVHGVFMAMLVGVILRLYGVL